MTTNKPENDMDEALRTLGQLLHARRMEFIDECRTDPLTIQSELELNRMGFYGPLPDASEENA